MQQVIDLTKMDKTHNPIANPEYSSDSQLSSPISAHHSETLAALNAINSAVNQSLVLDQIIQNALQEIAKFKCLGADVKAMIALLDQQTGRFSPAAKFNIADGDICLNSKQVDGSHCSCRAVPHGSDITIIPNATPHHNQLCFPLVVRGKTTGRLAIWTRAEKNIPDENLALLAFVADQVAIAIDNARLFKSVSRQRETLRTLSKRLAETTEFEKQRLARELHDRVGQNLTALGLNLNILQTQLSTDSQARVQSRLNDSLELLQQTAEHVRDVTADLRPPVLDDYGLIATLQWYGNQFTNRTGIEVLIKGEELKPRLLPAIENTLFRITQEAMMNVAKHAKADKIEISVAKEGTTVQLTIEDNGIGFAPNVNRLDKDQAWGLLTMAERAESIGGCCFVESSPGKGTKVVIKVMQ